MASYYRLQLDAWLKEIEVEAPVILDVAAGDRPAMSRVKSCKYTEYYTVDAERKYKPNLWHDMNHFMDYTKTPWEKQADVIFCLELAEYLWNPVAAMATLNNWLRRGGILYMSFPFIYPQHEPVPHDHLRYTRQWIERIMVEEFRERNCAGFSDFEITPRLATAGAPLLRNFYSVERMHPAKDANHDVIGWLLKARK